MAPSPARWNKARRSGADKTCPPRSDASGPFSAVADAPRYFDRFELRQLLVLDRGQTRREFGIGADGVDDVFDLGDGARAVAAIGAGRGWALDARHALQDVVEHRQRWLSSALLDAARSSSIFCRLRGPSPAMGRFAVRRFVGAVASRAERDPSLPVSWPKKIF